MLTPFQIAERADLYNGIANVAKINKLFRKQDESDLWPVCGEFNATERAIRRIRKARADGVCINDGLEYALALDNEISIIVNAL